MNDRLQPLFTDLMRKMFAFLPSVLGGIILLAVGWALGWFAKRLVIQLALLSKMERFLVRFSWGQVFFKADVRYGLYRFLGNIAFAVVFLIFLEFAFAAWDLKIISDLLATCILLLPRTLVAGIIFLVGWIVALRASKSTQTALSHQRIPGPRLAGYFTRAALVVFFSAMALLQLNIAREIVVVGFFVAFVTLGMIAVIMVFFLGLEFCKKSGKGGEEDEDRN